MTLHEIGIRHGTDKATYHNFCHFYEQNLTKPKSVLEIGILDGASLKMWKEWTRGQVEGWDINAVPVDGCHVMRVDAHDRAEISASADRFDLIIDDGPHTMKSQQLLWGILFPYCKEYVIEDLHTSVRADYQDGSPTTYDVLNTLSSPHWTPQERDYIRANVRDIRVFRGKPDDSWTAIIRKKGP